MSNIRAKRSSDGHGRFFYSNFTFYMQKKTTNSMYFIFVK